MTLDRRSGCPINLSLEVFGDRWSLIILRDMIFGGRRHFRELLNHSMEGIASNILADRLKRLVELGMLTKADDPSHKQKAIYSLTEMSITLVPIMAQLGAWAGSGCLSRKNCPSAPSFSRKAVRRCGRISWTSYGSNISAPAHPNPPKPRCAPGCGRLTRPSLTRRRARLPEFDWSTATAKPREAVSSGWRLARKIFGPEDRGNRRSSCRAFP